VVHAKSTPINIVNQLFIAKQSNSSWSVFETCEIPVGVLLVSCSFGVEYYCSLIKYIGVVSANYPCALRDSYSIEQELGNLSRALISVSVPKKNLLK
jgi:hypothetical protein